MHLSKAIAALSLAASVLSAAGAALQRSPIKNKVLKLDFEVLVLRAEAAWGEGDPIKLAEEQGKLDANVGLDREQAGKGSRGVGFKGEGRS